MPFIGEAECLHPFLWKCGNQISVTVTKIPVIIFFNVCVYRWSQKPEKVIGSYEPGVTGGYELTNAGARNWTWTLCKSKYLTIQLLLTSTCDHSAISPVPRKSVEQNKLVKVLVHCQLPCCLKDCGKASCYRSNKWQRKLFNLWKPGIKDKEKEEGSLNPFKVSRPW